MIERNNSTRVLVKFLRKFEIALTEKSARDELDRHPDSRSILAISDVLNWFEVPNIAYRVRADELLNLDTPFIAHTRRNNDFVIVEKIDTDKIMVSDHQRDNYEFSLADFQEIYNGVVLTSESSNISAAVKPTVAERLEPYTGAAAAALLILSLIGVLFNTTNFFFSGSWPIIAFAIAKSIGLVASILLLVQSIDKNNPLVQSLCKFGSKTNCNAILTSKAATAFKGLTWSEVGLFYFAGTWLVLLFATVNQETLRFLALLNALSLPYTIYSVNYQARIAKQWCTLCLLVQIVLWVEFVALIYSGVLSSANGLFPVEGYRGGMIVTLASLLALPVATWLLLRPLLLKARQLTGMKAQLHRFKYNRGLFEASLRLQPKFETPDDQWSIVLGNKKTDNVITVVSNPYCPPCVRAHRELDQWIERLSNIQLRIIFATGEDPVKSPLAKGNVVARHLMALSKLGGEDRLKAALKDWYGQKYGSYDDWAQNYPIDIPHGDDNPLIKQRAWCEAAKIEATPSVFIRGYFLPYLYRLHDIRYLLE